MKNPLRKRLPRELKGELGKYLVVFILMVLTIGMVSGFLVADGSMIVAYNDGFDKYNIENGNFRTNQQIYKSQKEEIQNLGIKLYENFYIEELPAEQRRIILLRIEGHSWDEIASRLGVSINTVKTQKSRSYKFLREKLANSSYSVLLTLIFY